MKNEQHISTLIEKAVKGKTTKAEEQELLQLSAQDPDIRLELQIMRDVRQGLIEIAVDNARALFEKIESSLPKLKSAAPVRKPTPALLETLGQYVDYTLAQLQQIFAPIPAYQHQLARAASRAAAHAPILQPVAGYDCTDYVLPFVLAKPLADLDDELEIIVEDNQYNELWTEEFDCQTTNISVQLDPKKFPPGRYYWKLGVGDTTFIGEFFIRKDLLPDEM